MRREGCCWKYRGVTDAGGCCFRREGKERRVPSIAAVGLHLHLVAGAVEDVAANLDCNQRWGWSSQLEAMLLMVGDVCSAERGGQGWCGGDLGIKPERKRKAMEGLLCLFLVTGEEEEERKSMKGGGGREQRLECQPPFSGCSLFFSFFFLVFLVMASSWGFLCFFFPLRSSFFFAWTEIYIYSARVSLYVKNKVLIKLIFFFKFWIWLKSNSKVNDYHYLEDKDYLEDKNKMTKTHYSL